MSYYSVRQELVTELEIKKSRGLYPAVCPQAAHLRQRGDCFASRKALAGCRIIIVCLDHLGTSYGKMQR